MRIFWFLLLCVLIFILGAIIHEAGHIGMAIAIDYRKKSKRVMFREFLGNFRKIEIEIFGKVIKFNEKSLIKPNAEFNKYSMFEFSLICLAGPASHIPFALLVGYLFNAWLAVFWVISGVMNFCATISSEMFRKDSCSSDGRQLCALLAFSNYAITEKFLFTPKQRKNYRESLEVAKSSECSPYWKKMQRKQPMKRSDVIGVVIAYYSIILMFSFVIIVVFLE